VRALAVISQRRQRRQLEFQSDHWALDVVWFCVGVWVGMQRS
jgi:hypothetical protein